ncbi:hypothetical protein [Streptomyces sp. NPDC014622]|uniref:hypothetical protein n=1 Tax=Streptomyces sp. NPDC014622 TaxID=3364874 RepID=UPI0037022D7E
MHERNQFPRAVHLTDPYTPLVPHPYPGCDVCKALVTEWIALTEPASPAYDVRRADDVAREINEHRRKDERQAPKV